MLPETEATPAFPMSCFVRFMLSRMIGTRGAAANVEIKQVKKEIQDKWNVLIENSLKTLALCSESTGKSNLAVVSVGTIGDATENAKVCSLPVTPCMELPGSPSESAIFGASEFGPYHCITVQLESHSQIPLLPASFSSNIKIWLKFPSLFPSARNLTPITQKSRRPSPCLAVFLISRWFVLSIGFHLGTRNTCCMSRFITVLTRIFEIYLNCILSLSTIWKGSIRHPYVRRHTKSSNWNGMYEYIPLRIISRSSCQLIIVGGGVVPQPQEEQSNVFEIRFLSELSIAWSLNFFMPC
ncbi:hypothetical protein DVH24_005861 [Malus domestica]|uniref:Uncharacterized protein n=1 Tax=Malus domestica TaxID=3750 RepID=A0A498IJ71_MALDO|nr:hypothetical protein DVH24_005861 [Malus domestica]